jgi:hypothetical protein
LEGLQVRRLNVGETDNRNGCGGLEEIGKLNLENGEEIVPLMLPEWKRNARG